MYVCIHVYIYMYSYTHPHTYTHLQIHTYPTHTEYLSTFITLVWAVFLAVTATVVLIMHICIYVHICVYVHIHTNYFYLYILSSHIGRYSDTNPHYAYMYICTYVHNADMYIRA